MPDGTAVVWFRRDLRLHDHPALSRAVQRYRNVAPLFVVDQQLVVGPRASPNRLWFMARSVELLAEELTARGAPLSLRRGDPAQEVLRFARQVEAEAILVSRDYTPYGRRRDRRTAELAKGQGIDFVECPGVLAREPESVERADGGHFLVFGAFRRAWEQLALRDAYSAPSSLPGLLPATAGPASVSELVGDPQPTADVRLVPEPGETAARRRLSAWAASTELDEYHLGRDRLDRQATSRLSQDLRWGLLSPREVLATTAGPGEGRSRFRAEIGWRDFYAHLLWHEPRVARQAFRTELEQVAWESDERLLDAWREGRTGYPLVDAAMRQLLASGWMHNRARMIVASFLTKHLGFDWRAGEAHFMRHLLDGDLASNSGGWQWAASTGTDAQPWFRIFNPTLQGRRHDPDGDYVRRWLPELASLTGADVHEPPAGAYLPPIVEHRAARQRALAAYGTN